MAVAIEQEERAFVSKIAIPRIGSYAPDHICIKDVEIRTAQAEEVLDATSWTIDLRTVIRLSWNERHTTERVGVECTGASAPGYLLCTTSRHKGKKLFRTILRALRQYQEDTYHEHSAKVAVLIGGTHMHLPPFCLYAFMQDGEERMNGTHICSNIACTNTMSIQVGFINSKLLYMLHVDYGNDRYTNVIQQDQDGIIAALRMFEKAARMYNLPLTVTDQVGMFVGKKAWVNTIEIVVTDTINSVSAQ
jgi:hypothetical protein